MHDEHIDLHVRAKYLTVLLLLSASVTSQNRQIIYIILLVFSSNTTYQLKDSPFPKFNQEIPLPLSSSSSSITFVKSFKEVVFLRETGWWWCCCCCDEDDD